MESILPLLKQTNIASKKLQKVQHTTRINVITDLSRLLLEHCDWILSENQKDLDLMDKSDSKYDRLLLDTNRITQLANSLIEITKLEDPTRKVLLEKELDNGLVLKKITTAMGVIATIFESRPNVTIDVAALCILSSNAAVLKGGKEAYYSNKAFEKLIHQALELHNLPKDLVLLLPTDRKYLNEVLEATKYIDLVIPRGSQALIDFVRNNSKIPVIETGAGVCHIYVEKSADINMAVNVILNAKASRPSVCNSLDCLLIEEEIAEDLIDNLIKGLEKHHIAIFADDKAFEFFSNQQYSSLHLASESDFGKEWLDYKLSIKIIKDYNEALDHISEYSSKHSEAIITENIKVAEDFLMEVDAAAVYHNASTRFTDGGQFGLGAEIGISTQKLHARGPFALEKLVTEKWIGIGKGQVRW